MSLEGNWRVAPIRLKVILSGFCKLRGLAEQFLRSLTVSGIQLVAAGNIGRSINAAAKTLASVVITR